MKYLLISLFLVGVAQAQSLEGYQFNLDQKDAHPFQKTLSHFTTDGCSRYSDGPKEDPTLWQHCCVQHDAKYWLGGTEEERKAADEELQSCVISTGHESDAKIMYSGTRAGGGPLRHTTYRWGYGWNRIRDYAPLSDEEKNLAKSLYGEDLQDLKKTITENKYVVTVPDSYAFKSPFNYTYCDEQIINYLSPKLLRSARVLKTNSYQITDIFHIRVKLDICEDTLDFSFSRKTKASTCKKDYAYSNQINKISAVEISKKCLERMSSEN